MVVQAAVDANMVERGEHEPITEVTEDIGSTKRRVESGPDDSGSNPAPGRVGEGVGDAIRAEAIPGSKQVQFAQ